MPLTYTVVPMLPTVGVKLNAGAVTVNSAVAVLLTVA